MAYARIARVLQCLAVVCDTFQATAYRAYAIRPYKWRKTIIAHAFPNTPKTTWDIGKTTSDAGKIMSDVENPTSDIIFSISNLLLNSYLQIIFKTAAIACLSIACGKTGFYCLFVIFLPFWM